MIFRKMTQEDIKKVAGNSMSRGILHKQPAAIEFDYCLEHEGKILAVGGFRLINETTAWAWLDMTNHAKDHLIGVYRVTKEWMRTLTEELGVKRLQAYVEADFVEGIRLIQHLGFHFEYTMHNFVGNKPACMYVKFYGD
jgi:RimJ/RimL family protein N-acetyltransferase